MKLWPMPSFPIPSTKEKKPFEHLVDKGIAAIHRNEFQKVVLSRSETVKLENFDAIATFKKLRNTYPAAFTYCFFHPEIGMWFGASPEQLLKVRTNQFETIALAGTQKFEGDENVHWENKEQEEQRFVTDFILENLENVTSDIAFSNPYTYRAGNLLHIKTDISGTLHEDSNVRQLLDILHPTPAVCGLPKEKARDFILEHEGYDRKYYSGYLGELDLGFHSGQKMTDLFVNLRCMEIKGDSALLYIGCGVTKDSDPHKEYIETVNKSMTIKKILF
ncbi:isochorismate synthase [Flavobacterium sp.]|uniref:isochorismate synthase n=1 Tax=Flavobacterium sp. TaxID=239 RepID=UPI0039E5093E